MDDSENIFKLYTGRGYNKMAREATVAIERGIKEGKITLANINDNPILEKYRSVGADDTVSRDTITDFIRDNIKKKCIKPIVVDLAEKRVLGPILNAIVDSDYFDENRPKGMSKRQCNAAINSLLRKLGS